MKNYKRAFTVILTLALALTTVTGIAFADVDYSNWDSQSAYPSDVVNTPLFAPVKFLIDNKALTGYPDGTYKPEKPIIRAEVASAIAKMTNRTNNLSEMEKLNLFTDLSGYNWAKGYINTLASEGIIKGLTDTTYGPAKNISYAELITMLIRAKGGAASEIESVGTWPNNYIQYAQMYNLLGDVVVTDWSADATRGDLAKLMYRMMPKK